MCPQLPWGKSPSWKNSNLIPILWSILWFNFSLMDIVYSPNEKKLHLIFEFADYDLKKYLKLNSSNVTSYQIKLFMFQLINGINYCHSRRIIHRDLKPQNLLIDKNGKSIFKLRWLENRRFWISKSFWNPYQNPNTLNWNIMVQSAWGAFRTKTIQFGSWYLGRWMHFCRTYWKKTSLYRRLWNWSNLQDIPIPWNSNSQIMVKHQKPSRFQANFPKIQVSRSQNILQKLWLIITRFVYETCDPGSY